MSSYKKDSKDSDEEGTRVAGGSNGPSNGIPEDQVRLHTGNIGDALTVGRERARELSGMGGIAIGKKRAEIRGKYEDAVNAPSRGSKRVAGARNAAGKNLKASQAQSGVKGSMMEAQQQQQDLDYSGKLGDVRQKEYMDALSKIEKQYRGMATDSMKTEGQMGALAIGQAVSPTVDGGGSFICTELKNKGLVSSLDLFLIHFILLVGSIFRPSQTIFYFTHGRKLVDKMFSTDWRQIKIVLFDTCFNFMKKGKFISAVNHYEDITRVLFLNHGFADEVAKFDGKWKLKNVLKSYKIMWGVKNG